MADGTQEKQPVLAADGTPIEDGDEVLVRAKVIGAGHIVTNLPRMGDKAVVALEMRGFDGGAGFSEPMVKVCTVPSAIECHAPPKQR